MKYWVNINGIQQGPLSIDELRNIEFDPEVTYVWHQDLDDWHKIGELDEFADIVATVQKRIEAKRAATSSIPPLPQTPLPSQASDATKQEATPATESVDTEPINVNVPPIPRTTSAEPASDTFKSTPPPLDYQCPKPPMTNVPPIPTAPRPMPRYCAEGVCEPQKTYLVPAILVLLLCCQVTGIIATVYAALTSSSNSSGDYAKAKKYSEFAQVWIMISIALGLVYMPISILLIMLS